MKLSLPMTLLIAAGLGTTATATLFRPTLAPFAAPASAAAEVFERARIYLVYQAIDDDAQVFLEGAVDEIPIERVWVRGPDGSAVAQALFHDSQGAGQAYFTFESTEPSLDAIRLAYPEGNYLFFGQAYDGTLLRGKATFSHAFQAAPNITHPLEGAVNVPVDDVVATWDPIAGAERIQFEIEDGENDATQDIKLVIDLDPSATSFQIPNGWLRNDVRYTMDVRAVWPNGNQTVVDIDFTTEP